MKELVEAALAHFRANSVLAKMNGPFEDEAPVDATKDEDGYGRDYCTFTYTAGPTTGYMNDDDEQRTASIIFNAYTFTPGRERDYESALDRVFDHKQFAINGGYCEDSRRISANSGYAGVNARQQRMKALTYAVQFKFHAPGNADRVPSTT